LVEQVRLCANLLYGCVQAQDFLRLSGGLPVLLSHCYSDADLPLLREAGVFAVRNATHHNLANQEAVRRSLAERRQVAEAAAAAGNASVDAMAMAEPNLPAACELELDDCTSDA
jgi:hypothetical protein